MRVEDVRSGVNMMGLDIMQGDLRHDKGVVEHTQAPT